MFSIKADFDHAERILSDLGRKQLPFATALALNDTAQDILEKNKAEMSRTFDRPTRWTLNAFYVKRARKTKLEASVQRKRAQSGRHYLEVESEGGVRPQTGLEKLMATRLAYGGIVRTVTPASGARLTAAGNWSGGQRNQVLSAVKSQRDARTNATARSNRRNPNRAKYFVARDGGHLPSGIYQRMAGKRLKKVVHISGSSAKYDRRFKFREVSMAEARQRFRKHFVQRLEAAIATAKK